MSIRGVRLRDFRGFRDASVDLKPLTVLLGPNSAGKSVWGHALSAMAHAHYLHPSGERITLSADPREAEEWPIDLGLLTDLRTQGSENRVVIGLHTSEGWVDFGFGLPGFFDDTLRLTSIAYSQGPQESAIGPVSIHQMDAGPEQSVTIPIRGEGRAQPVSSGLNLQRINEIEWRDIDSGELVTIDLKGFELLTVKHRPGGTSLVVNSTARREVTELLKRLTYLRASRQRPLRSYRLREIIRQEIGYGGERLALVLKKRGIDNVEWLEPPAIAGGQEGVHLDAPWRKRKDTLLNATGFWLGHLGLARALKAMTSPRSEDELEIRASLEGQESRDLTEIGFGISQVAPVIVAGLLEQADGLFIVDLPEAHLHPRPQAALADFFCALALSGRASLVETHSEMFFHRLRLRAEMNYSLRDRMAVYFIDPPTEGCCRPPRPVGLGFDDELSWPAGFLQEGWENETQINAVRQARRRAAREGAS